MPNGAENEVEFAGKFGGSIQADSIAVYGAERHHGDGSAGTKLGLKYSF